MKNQEAEVILQRKTKGEILPLPALDFEKNFLEIFIR